MSGGNDFHFIERDKIGATANAAGPEVELYADNLRISVEE